MCQKITNFALNCYNAIYLHDNNLILLTNQNSKFMKKIFTLIAAAFVAVSVSADVVQVNINTSGEESVAANTELSDNECFTATTAFATPGKAQAFEYAHAGVTFPAWIEIRVDDEPSADNPNGTNNKNKKTSVIIVAKKSAKLSAYVRTGPNKVVKLFDKATFTALESSSSYTPDGKKNNLWTWTWNIEAGHEYVLTEKGGTGCLSGFTYELGTSTGITSVENAVEADAATYNVAGQRVNANAKGLVIKNGKKYINR